MLNNISDEILVYCLYQSVWPSDGLESNERDRNQGPDWTQTGLTNQQ